MNKFEHRFIITSDGMMERDYSFYGNAEVIKLFKSKEDAESFISGWSHYRKLKNVKVKKIRIFINIK